MCVCVCVKNKYLLKRTLHKIRNAAAKNDDDDMENIYKYII